MFVVILKECFFISRFPVMFSTKITSTYNGKLPSPVSLKLFFRFETKILLGGFLWLLIACEAKPNLSKNFKTRDLYLSILSSINDYHYFPQITIPFASSFPNVCASKAQSNIQIACYNWTSTQFFNARNSNEDYLTHFLPEVNSWSDLNELITTYSKGSLTSNQYKWIVVYNEYNNKAKAKPTKSINSPQNFTVLLEQTLLNTSFRMENPLNIQLSDSKTNSESFTNIQAFKMNLVAGTQTNIILKNGSYDIIPSEMSLTGYTLFVAGVNDPEYDYDTKVETDSQNRTTFVSGFAVEILHALQDILNFSVNPIITKDWGSFNETTEEWGGMVGAAIRDEIDLAMSSSANSRRRAGIVEYNIHTHTNTITAFFKRYSGLSMNPLLLPFQMSLWASIAVWMCISKFVYILIQKIIFHILTYKDDSSISAKEIFPWIVASITYRDQQKVPRIGLQFTSLTKLTEIFLLNVFSLLNVSKMDECRVHESGNSSGHGGGNVKLFLVYLPGIPNPPTTLPLRALYFSELIVAIILNAAFSGTLISYLSMDYNPIRTVADVVNIKDFKVEAVTHQGTRENLRESSDINTKNLYWKSVNYDRPNKLTESPIKEIMKGKFVYLIDHLGGFGEITRQYNPIEACNIQDIPIMDQILKQGSFVRKGAKLRKIIDYGLLKIMESGLNGVFKSRYLFHSPVCNTHVEYSGADMVDLQLAFLLLLGGYVLSFAMCAIEIVWSKLFPSLSIF